MSGIFRKIIFSILAVLFSVGYVTAQQNVTLDWKLYDVGKVRQMITNMGTLWPTWVLGEGYPGLIFCEFPPNSSQEHIGEGGIWVGAITPGNDSLVSVTTGWGSNFEFYPSEEPWDSIWVVGRNDTVDIPYWPDYVGKSDQDFVCHYGDYYVTNISDHEPLYLDVIQISYAWSSAPLDEIVIHRFYVISRQYDLHDVYFAYWLDGNVGFCAACRSDYGFGRDDLSHYFPDDHFGVAIDVPGGTDGTAISPIGVKIYPQEGVNPQDLRWSFNWFPNGVVPGRDGERYRDMAAGMIMQNQQQALNGSQFMVSFGPFDLAKGDTMSFTVGEILGSGRLQSGVLTGVEEPGLNTIFANLGVSDLAVANDFNFPSPPPRPPVSANIQSGQVILEWDDSVEHYQDPYRVDETDQPFEGYRVYKSTQSSTGPWTLLGQFDVAGNDFEPNTGIERHFEDTGLLDYFEYFYTVTAFSKPDTGFPIQGGFPSQESSLNANAITVVPGPEPKREVDEVAVVPNPYRGDIAYQNFDPPWEKPDATRRIWLEQDRRVLFINLPAECEIRIYTLSGDLVTTIQHRDEVQGYVGWNLTSSIGQAVSSGIYLYSVKNLRTGEVQIGKFVIIK